MNNLGEPSSAMRAVHTADGLRKRTGARRWPFEQSLIETRIGLEVDGPEPDTTQGNLASAIALAGETLRAVLADDATT